ncbi:Cytochrome P450 [Macrophomina phaseolina MS6]|uniref:Cytochrome P450 n=1 Tax=Macrophomina phaseolina (strain MS6) TaxID=1126212 RepID=K2RN76_MACPH|nr:Cytochrome P450 [Macrophomina phaseolina MS6]
MMENERDDTGMVRDIHAANNYLAHCGLLPDLHPWIMRLQYLMGKSGGEKVLINFIQGQINRHREANAKPNAQKAYDSFLNKLIKIQDQNRVTMPHMLDSCGSNLGAGSDTTAITLSATLYYLYNNPEKLNKLRDEIDTMAASGRISDPVSFQEAQDMPYLQAVIKEALRMHPAVGTMLARKVPKGGVNLAGYYFPEGVSTEISTEFRPQIAKDQCRQT